MPHVSRASRAYTLVMYRVCRRIDTTSSFRYSRLVDIIYTVVCAWVLRKLELEAPYKIPFLFSLIKNIFVIGKLANSRCLPKKKISPQEINF